ncbi:MAG TPA: hypothetical protein VLX90_21675, partial [Steroidobacteraceae bacterium]|nr:hypothetical protein [Steroidobacteraceae bacterium]
PAVLSTPQMPRSVYARIREIGARAVVAERDFTWNLAVPEQERSRWSYRGLRLSLEDLPPSALAGSIQYRNAAVAIAAIECLPGAPGLTDRSVRHGLGHVRLAGRFQIVPGEVEWILDIAHNEPAARMFAQHVRERPQGEGGRTLAVVGILGDKDAPAIVRELEPLVNHWMLCSLPGPRGVTAAALAQRVQLPPGRVTLADSVEQACELARAAARPGDRVIVFGSVHTVGPALQWLRIY